LLAGFATSLSIIISFLAGVVLFNFQVTTPFLVGCSMVLAATWFYNQPESRQSAYHPVTTTGATNGHSKDAYSVDVPSAGSRRYTAISDAGSQMGDPEYPYASYPNASGNAPKFINVSPFLTGQETALKTTPGFLQTEDNVSPRSPIPPFIEGQPFGPSSKYA
jgi:hypothetical protein